MPRELPDTEAFYFLDSEYYDLVVTDINFGETITLADISEAIDELIYLPIDVVSCAFEVKELDE